MIGPALFLLCVAGAMQVQSVPWTPEKSSCFVADATLDGSAEVFVLRENMLEIYGHDGTKPLFSIALPTGTSAIDVADIDRNGTADIVAVCGAEILKFPLSTPLSAEGQVLFTRESQFSGATGFPFPSVLVVEHEGKSLIALPANEVLELCTSAGEVVETYPIDVQTPYHPPAGRPFNYAINQHAQSGPSTALEIRINSTVSFQAVLDDPAGPAEADTPVGRPGTSRQQWEAGALEPEQWPWFPVGTGPAGDIRALYRRADARDAATAIRIRTLPVAGSPPSPATGIGPVRQYPGTLLLGTDTAPDFNGDGFTDVLLWKSQQPSLTADSVARIVSEKSWPLRITSHMFLPEKGRYAPRPGSNLSVKVPFAWLLEPSRFGPLRMVLLRDFDGDGKTDFGCLTAEDRLTVWRADEAGLVRDPFFEHRFPEAIEQVLFEADLEGEGRSSVGLRAGRWLHILRPEPPAKIQAAP